MCGRYKQTIKRINMEEMIDNYNKPILNQNNK